MYGWMIDKEHVTTEEDLQDGLRSRVGWKGPFDLNPETSLLLDQGEGVPFRMFEDGDNKGDVLSYEGRIVWIGKEPTLFEPLDDLGAPDSGCTTIMYQNEQGEWKPL